MTAATRPDRRIHRVVCASWVSGWQRQTVSRMQSSSLESPQGRPQQRRTAAQYLRNVDAARDTQPGAAPGSVGTGHGEMLPARTRIAVHAGTSRPSTCRPMSTPVTATSASVVNARRGPDSVISRAAVAFLVADQEVPERQCLPVHGPRNGNPQMLQAPAAVILYRRQHTRLEHVTSTNLRL